MPRSPNERQPGKKGLLHCMEIFPQTKAMKKTHHLLTRNADLRSTSHASNMPEGPQSIWSKWRACQETRSHHPQIHNSKLLSPQLDIQPRIVDMLRFAICHSIWMPLAISCNHISLSYNLFQLKTKVESLKSCTPLLKSTFLLASQHTRYHTTPPPNLCKHSVMDEVDLEAICLQGQTIGETWTLVTGRWRWDGTSLVAGTTARCLTTSIRTVLTELVLFRTSAFAKDSSPSCFFAYARRPFVWVVNSEDAKTIKIDFSRLFFSTKEPTSLGGRSVFFAVCVLRFQGLAGGSNEVSRCTEFFPSGSLACEPTCTRPKLSPVRKKKLQVEECWIYIQENTRTVQQRCVKTKQIPQHRHNESHRPLSKTGLWPCWECLVSQQPVARNGLLAKQAQDFWRSHQVHPRPFSAPKERAFDGKALQSLNVSQIADLRNPTTIVGGSWLFLLNIATTFLWDGHSSVLILKPIFKKTVGWTTSMMTCPGSNCSKQCRLPGFHQKSPRKDWGFPVFFLIQKKNPRPRPSHRKGNKKANFMAATWANGPSGNFGCFGAVGSPIKCIKQWKHTSNKSS